MFLLKKTAFKFATGHESGALCHKTYTPLNGNDPKEANKLYTMWKREKCSMFHYMQSFTKTNSLMLPHNNSLLAKVMRDTCPIIKHHSLMF